MEVEWDIRKRCYIVFDKATKTVYEIPYPVYEAIKLSKLI